MSRKTKCWWCGRPADVRKDGALGKHRIHTESRYSGGGNFVALPAPARQTALPAGTSMMLEAAKPRVYVITDVKERTGHVV